MANVTIGQLSDLATPDSSDVAEAEKADGSASGKITFADLVTAGLGSDAGALAELVLDLANRHQTLVTWMLAQGFPVPEECLIPGIETNF